ncbi:MAG: type I methionyl aminopeptidase [Patescibacteria group bacterium]
MTILKDKKEIENLKEGGKILASVLYQVAANAQIGVATIELDKLAEKLIKQSGGTPSFKNYKTTEDEIPFPFILCVSINDEVVHGIPGKRALQNGDIVGLDLGMKYKKLYTDMAITIPVGKVSDKVRKIIRVAEKSLDAGINAAKNGARIGDIGFVVQSYVEQNGFSVVRKLVGHGLGYKPHETPEIPNFGKKGTGVILMEGVVLAIEPMITAGGSDVFLDDDMWTWKTKDGSLAAHFEHTIIITKSGAEIITKI